MLAVEGKVNIFTAAVKVFFFFFDIHIFEVQGGKPTFKLHQGSQLGDIIAAG